MRLLSVHKVNYFCVAMTISLMTMSLFSVSFPAAGKESVKEISPQTIIFVKNSSNLTVIAKSKLNAWKPQFQRASRITITGFAPNIGKSSKQRQLARKRAQVTASQLKLLGITAVITQKINLQKPSLRQSVDRATILVTAVKPTPTVSPSASSSPSNSPTASPSPTTTPAYKLSGSLILDFVDCNQFQKQALAKSITFSATTPGSTPQKFTLTDSNTGHANNNSMNCEFTWSDLDLAPGSYSAAIEISCQEIPDIPIPTSAFCTPGNYARLDKTSGNQVSFSGSGPTEQASGHLMSINLPDGFVVDADKVLNFEGWFTVSTD